MASVVGGGKIVKSGDDRENGLELKDTKIMNNADSGIVFYKLL